MSSLTFDILVQERHSEPVTAVDDTAAGTEGKGKGPRFPRLATALDEARLAERGHSKVAQRQMPRFQRLEKAIASEPIGAVSGLNAAGFQHGADEDIAPGRSWLKLLPACFVVVVAGAVVAVAGGALMAQWAATSPVESREAPRPHLPLSDDDGHLPAMEDVSLPPLGTRHDLRPRIVGEVGGRAPHAAPQDPASSSTLAGLLGERRAPDALQAPVVQRFALLATDPDDVYERRSVPPAAVQHSVVESPPTKPTALMEEATSSPYVASYLSAYNRGYALQREERYSEALASYQLAIELKPELPYALYNLGAVLSRLGRLEDAAAAFEKAANLDQTNPFIFYDWGWALEKLGAVDMAIEKYQLAIAADAESNAGLNASKRLGVLQQ